MIETMKPIALQQAAKPQGVFGVVMGWLLENGNAQQNRATVDALAPPHGASVLEIGFGPGHALEMLAMSRPIGLVAGIDHSPLMVARARRRLNGRRGDAALDLRIGDAGDLPFPDERFDVVFAVNTFHLLPDRERALAEMAGVLKPGGDILLSIRNFRAPVGLGSRFEPPKGAEAAKAAAETMKALGLQVRLREVVHSPRRATLLVRGRKVGRPDS
jgi:ubiquinone/menaquinone biosynthesis C-methylase UbiE